MAIPAGTRLGHFEVVAAIGAGGMGEVYKARDTRLDRIVAIKVLPPHLADKPELRERFEREARTIASLNHPHICTLYDVGHQDGTDFLVMEYLEGETLATRLLKGPLPLEQVLQYAIEISDALDKAHRKGVTHRDIKPGNVMLTKSGTKLLDFGLAKLKQAVAPASLPESQMATLSRNPTVEGTLLGTIQYMAPEQVEGKQDEIDGRTDIFAFGALVYEMATGKKAFEGKSTASLFAKILEHDPPPISSLQPMTPPALDRVVRRCLVKERDQRWQAASDLCEELKWITESRTQAQQDSSPRKGLLKDVRLTWSVAGILFVALLVLAFAYLRRAPGEVSAIRFYVSPPQSWTVSQQLGRSGSAPVPLAVSPDGRRIAIAATNAEGKTQLWVRSLDTIDAVALAGTDGATRPFWSPDSRGLGFFADGKLKRIDVAGGPPITLCDAPDDRSGTWSKDGAIVFAPMANGALQKVSALGGTTTPASVLRADETAHRRPFFLPDGRHFIFRAITATTGVSGPFYLASLDSTDRKLLLTADSGTIAYSQRHLLYLRGTTLMAQPFDVERLTFTGDAFPIAEQIQIQSSSPGFGVFSASLNGVLAYQTGVGVVGTRLSWFDRAGKELGVLGDAVTNTDLQLSPDAKHLSVDIPDQTGERDIWLYDVSRGVRTRFTFDPADEFTSAWSPDGTRVAFNSRRKGHLDLYQKSSNGAGNEELVFEDDLEKYPYSWSPDGKFLLYAGLNSLNGSTGYDLFVLPPFAESLGGSGQARKPVPFLQTRHNEFAGQFSPDGRWIAYHSDESGRFEVYVAPFSGDGGKWQVSTNGGGLPRWRRDASEIFYLTPDNKMMAVEVDGKGGSFQIGQTKMLFDTHVSASTLRYSYDVSPDGQRFLINSIPVQTATAPITVVADWTAGLKK